MAVMASPLGGMASGSRGCTSVYAKQTPAAAKAEPDGLTDSPRTMSPKAMLPPHAHFLARLLSQIV